MELETCHSSKFLLVCIWHGYFYTCNTLLTPQYWNYTPNTKGNG